MANSQGRIKKK